MFEHKKEKLLPAVKFYVRMLEYIGYAMLLVSFSLLIGTMGYCYFAQLNWVDGFYNAAMILTGMGPVANLTTNEAKLFASFYAIYSGVAFLTTVAVVLAPVGHRMLHALNLDEE